MEGEVNILNNRQYQLLMRQSSGMVVPQGQGVCPWLSSALSDEVCPLHAPQ